VFSVSSSSGITGSDESRPDWRSFPDESGRRSVAFLTSVDSDRPGNARDINFDPLVLPDGIEPSDDPLLSARSAVYGASYRKRSSEPETLPVIQVDGIA